jgi:hypothetical protein
MSPGHAQKVGHPNDSDGMSEATPKISYTKTRRKSSEINNLRLDGDMKPRISKRESPLCDRGCVAWDGPGVALAARRKLINTNLKNSGTVAKGKATTPTVR